MISYSQLFGTAVCGAGLAFSLAPLFFEYTVELTYPVPEGLVGAFLTCFYNTVGIIFLSIFFVPHVGQIWTNYVLVGAALGNEIWPQRRLQIVIIFYIYHFSLYSGSDLNDRNVPTLGHRCTSFDLTFISRRFIRTILFRIAVINA